MKPASASQGPTAPHVFVNYTHPSQRHQKEQRFVIQSHVSGHYRRKNKQIKLPSTRTRQWHVPECKTESLPDLVRHVQNVEQTAGVFKHRRPCSTDPQSDHLICCPGRDPFDAYPIEARDCVPAAFDYCKPSLTPYGPETHLPRVLIWKTDTRVFAPAHASVCGTNNVYLTKLIPLAMQHPVLFEGLVALSQCHLTANYDPDRPDKDTLYHRGQALRLLRHTVKSLSTPPDDAVIWTSVLLLGIDVSNSRPGDHPVAVPDHVQSVYKDHESWEAHMNGLISMIKLRGGLHLIDPTLRTIILQ